MTALFRLENEAYPKGRRNEKVARSKAECQTSSDARKNDKKVFNYSLARAFDEGWKDPEVIQSYSDMINGIPQCGITGKRCPFIDCKANDRGKFRK